MDRIAIRADEVADLLHVSTRTVRRMTLDGRLQRLPMSKIPGHTCAPFRILVSSLVPLLTPIPKVTVDKP